MAYDIDNHLFKQACDKIVNIEREKNGIGTLQEKTVHAVLKNFYEPDISHQEIRLGNFVADIFRDDEIIEIQTRSFNAMRRKLDAFLAQYPVTIVHPIIHTKWLCWIDETTGEVSKKRKSPKTGSIYDAFDELYKIKSYLTNPNLHLCFTLIDAEEYRLLNGWSNDRKKGSTRYDRIPVNLVEEHFFYTPDDFSELVPEALPETFTSSEFAKAAKITRGKAQIALNVLTHTKTVTRVGKKGRSILYSITNH